MKRRHIFWHTLIVVSGFILLSSCQRSQPPDQPQDSPRQAAVAVPADLQDTINQFVHAVENFDILHILDAYAEDFRSGSGRSKEDIHRIFTQLRSRNVKLKIEKAVIENTQDKSASLRTQIRLRYPDSFRNLGEGEVVITDVLQHALRKNEAGWKIYTDDRVSTYREGRFGPRSPNAQLDVPSQLPTNSEYTVTVTVRREQDVDYQVMVGNYAEDQTILPPPDFVTPLPDSGVLQTQLLPNPQGRGEMVRITIIAGDREGQWLGATTISKFVPGTSHQQEAGQQKRT